MLLEDNCSERESEQVVKLLLPGQFKLIHGGHAHKIRKARENFTAAHLTVGVLNDPSSTSVLSLQEKVQTLQSIKGVDQVKVLSQPLTKRVLDLLGVDYLVTSSQHKYPLEERVVRLEKPSEVDSDEIIARVLENYDSHALQLIAKGFDPQRFGLSSRGYIALQLRHSVNTLTRSFRNKVWTSTHSLEQQLDCCRLHLQKTVGTWTELTETALRDWLCGAGTGCKQLLRALRRALLDETS